MDLNRIEMIKRSLQNSSQSSDDFLVWGVLILVLVIMAVSIGWSIWAGKKRKEALQQIALETSLKFHPCG